MVGQAVISMVFSVATMVLRDPHACGKRFQEF